jgi:hypothetical protein
MFIFRALFFLTLYSSFVSAQLEPLKQQEYVCFVLFNDATKNSDVFTIIDHTQLFKSGGVYIGRDQCITDCTLWKMFYSLHELDLSAGLLTWKTKPGDEHSLQMRISKIENTFPEIALIVCDESLQIKETLCIPLELIAQFFVHATLVAHIQAEENQQRLLSEKLHEIPTDEFDEFDEFSDEQLTPQKKKTSYTQYAKQLWAIAILQYYSLSDYCYETYKQLKDYIWPTKKAARVARR